MNNDNNKAGLKRFIIKLVMVTFSIIVIINVTYNLIFAEKFENINKLLQLDNIEIMKDKMREEIRGGLAKDKIFNEEDKKLLYQFYLKVKNEFKEIQEK
jgi:cell division protein YceG involved in septum cleavage